MPSTLAVISNLMQLSLVCFTIMQVQALLPGAGPVLGAAGARRLVAFTTASAVSRRAWCAWYHHCDAYRVNLTCVPART
jgi:hypothetical protein